MNDLPRTDLAAEAHGINAERGVDDGMILDNTELLGFSLCKAEIKKGEGERKSGRCAGTYYSLDVGKLWLCDSRRRGDAEQALAALIASLLPSGDAPVLVAGLGNSDIGADSVGPRCVSGLVVSHHLRSLNAALYNSLGLSDMAAVLPGVLGQTGVESAVLIKAAVEKLSPKCVIAVDALAARSVSRLGTTVQLSNAGIAPGSGVCNARSELSEGTLGVPVLALGVPTVVDAGTLVRDMGGKAEAEFDSFFVTPKETDLMARVVAMLFSKAINRAVHGDGFEEYMPL